MYGQRCMDKLFINLKVLSKIEEGQKGGFNLEKISAEHPRAYNLRVIEPKLEDIFLEFTAKK